MRCRLALPPLRRTVLILALLQGLSACSSLLGGSAPAPEEPPAPAEQPAPSPGEQPSLSAVGIASWYGARHHGKRTASGEAFDMAAMTAAHPTLPFNTIVRVTNTATGAMIKVRINDRGPSTRARLIDLSRAAAVALEGNRLGALAVRIEVFASDQPRKAGT
ncbi:MAG TPA: septal ring lytic transglycosylase RlpA family protein [Stellaceae bacterium]|nr:septal ring lytic transglycosylase RlpA family protein [Stellaceae bacterium]